MVDPGAPVKILLLAMGEETHHNGGLKFTE